MLKHSLHQKQAMDHSSSRVGSESQDYDGEVATGGVVALASDTKPQLLHERAEGRMFCPLSIGALLQECVAVGAVDVNSHLVRHFQSSPRIVKLTDRRVRQ